MSAASSKTPLGRTLATMGCEPPTKDEIAAIRAMLRGTASEGQSRRGLAYVMRELCGVGRVPFAGEATHGTAFRNGSLAVGIALAQIGDAVVMRFEADHSPDIHGEGETSSTSREN
jgi:hypothetical protein